MGAYWTGEVHAFWIKKKGAHMGYARSSAQKLSFSWQHQDELLRNGHIVATSSRRTHRKWPFSWQLQENRLRNGHFRGKLKTSQKWSFSWQGQDARLRNDHFRGNINENVRKKVRMS